MKYSEFSKLSYTERKKVPFSEKPTTNKVGSIIVVSIIFISAFLIFSDNEKSTQNTDVVGEEEAFVISKEFITDFLKSPQSAEFPTMDFHAINKGGNTFEVSSYVDAVNSFNAPIRTNYTITLKYNNGDWADTHNWTMIDIKTN